MPRRDSHGQNGAPETRRHDRGSITLCLAGDTMLGRSVGEVLDSAPPESLFAPELVAAARESDLFVLNLECCISTRGEPWPDPFKPFFFRAPPAAAEALAYLGVDCVTLANNHALDFGARALLDTIDHLNAAGIAAVGAGANVHEARQPVVLEAGGLRLAVIAFTDHPPDYAAEARRPGVALARLGGRVPNWLLATVGGIEADAVLVTPHWGPNMAARPTSSTRIAAAELVAAGATVIAGHSAHVFQGVDGTVLYDLGDFIDDYATDRVLRNDLGLLFLLRLDEEGPIRLEALPLKLGYCHTRLATGADAEWIGSRFREACAQFGTRVGEVNNRFLIDLRTGARPGQDAGSATGRSLGRSASRLEPRRV